MSMLAVETRLFTASRTKLSMDGLPSLYGQEGGRCKMWQLFTAWTILALGIMVPRTEDVAGSKLRIY